MYYKYLAAVIFYLTVILQPAYTTTYGLGSHHSNYDASLDPIIWSKGLVKDIIRKHRHYQRDSLTHNSLNGAGNEIPAQGYNYNGFGKKHSSDGNFDNDFGNSWYLKPVTYNHSGKFSNNIKKKLNRRKHRLNPRNRYELIL